MTGSRVGYRNQNLEISGPPVNGAYGAETGSKAAACVISESATPDQLYGQYGGLNRLTTYWGQQDRLLEEGRVVVGAPETLSKPAKGGNGGGSQGS
jgi:hypothetical protein